MTRASIPGAQTALGRLYAVLCAAAEQAAPCPGNRALCAGAGITREAAVTTLLANLRARGLIAVEWTMPVNGARRVIITATGKATGWSAHAPRWADGMRIPRDGAAGLARLLRESGRRFRDVTRSEARRVLRDAPADPGLPPRPEPSSWMGCALAGLPEDPLAERTPATAPAATQPATSSPA